LLQAVSLGLVYTATFLAFLPRRLWRQYSRAIQWRRTRDGAPARVDSLPA
jgi:hypothetical protein